jgi:hypothetical protein
MKGHVPSTDVIVVFAEALGNTPDEYARIADHLLRLAGKKARYYASVRRRRAAGPRPVAARLAA